MRYCEKLDTRIVRPIYGDEIKPYWHQFAVRSEYKKELCSHFAAHGVGNGTFYPVPLHQQVAFNGKNCGNAGANLPVAEMIAAQSVCLPIFPEITEEQIQTVIDVVNAFFRDAEGMRIR